MTDATVNTPSPAWEAMELDRKLPRTMLYEGQRGIRAEGETYLPKYEGELGSAGNKTTEYGRRLSQSYLVNFYNDAVRNLAGRVFSKGLQTSELDPQLQDFWENVDGHGTPGDVFAQDSAVDSLGQGMTETLVDAINTNTDDEAETQAQETIGVKWVPVRADTLIEATSQTIEGRDVLWRARRRETTSQVSGVADYNYTSSNLVRVMHWGDPFSTWELFEEQENHDWSSKATGNYIPHRSSSAEQKDAFEQPPLVSWYSWKTGFFEAKPPLLNLANLNLQHYQKKSDLDNIERIANVPQMVLEGATEVDQLEIGAYRLATIPLGASLKYLEIQGNGIAHLKESIKHLEEHIRLAGREPMVKKATGSELATVRMLDEAQHLTLAQAWATMWVGAINQCIFLTGAYLGIQNPGTVSISEDVMEDLARPDGFDDVIKLATLNVISAESTVKEAIRYGVLDREFDGEVEADRIEIEGVV